MIGFFEHQYLSYKKTHLKNLIALAKADGELHADEEKMLYVMGERYGLKDRQIASLIRSNKPIEFQVPEGFEDRMNQLYDLIIMVYADGVVEDSEVSFCENLMDQFAFKKEIVTWMIEMFDKGNPPTLEEWENIKTKAKDFII